MHLQSASPHLQYPDAFRWPFFCERRSPVHCSAGQSYSPPRRLAAPPSPLENIVVRGGGSLIGHDVWMSFHSRSFYTTVAPADGLLDGTNDLRRHENNSRVGRRDALYSPATSQGVHLSWAEDPCAASCWPQANYKFLKQIWMQFCLWL